MSEHDDDELALTDAEAGSVLWKRIEQHLAARLARYRIRNDGALSHEETIGLRARIAEIRILLAAGASRD